jgi:hypothetical protein
MDIFNTDIFFNIFDFLDENQYFIISEVCKYFNYTIKNSKKKIKFPKEYYIFSDLKILKWSLLHGYKFFKYKNINYYYDLCFKVSENKIKILNFLYYSVSKKLNKDLFDIALDARVSIDVFNWLKNKRCNYSLSLLHRNLNMSKEIHKWINTKLIWNELQLFDLMREDNFTIKDLSWVINSVPYLKYFIPNIAAQIGNFEALKFIDKKIGSRCQLFTEETIAYAADLGNKEILEWLIEHNCPWNFWTTTTLASNGYLELLEMCLEKGCEINDSSIIDSIYSGKINSIDWILSKYPSLLTNNVILVSKEKKVKYPEIYELINKKKESLKI